MLYYREVIKVACDFKYDFDGWARSEQEDLYLSSPHNLPKFDSTLGSFIRTKYILWEYDFLYDLDFNNPGEISQQIIEYLWETGPNGKTNNFSTHKHLKLIDEADKVELKWSFLPRECFLSKKLLVGIKAYELSYKTSRGILSRWYHPFELTKMKLTG